MTAIVCDTGPLLAVLNRRDRHHAASVALFDSFVGELIVPSLIVTEVCYLAQAQVGPQAEARFLDAIVTKELQVEDPTSQDWARIAQLVQQYSGFPLGVADASVIAVAERLDIVQLSSIDHRHMRAVTPRHCDAFELLPA